MAYKAQILLGTITKAHGFEGGVSIRLEKNFIENVPEIESVFLEIEGKPVPFFIALQDYPGGDVVRLKFDGFDNVHKVKEFSGCSVFLTSGVEKTRPGKDIRNFIGFKVYSFDNKRIGTIEELFENPGQILINVSTDKGKKILIPFHKNLIVRVDNRKKTIKMDLPEGLEDLNR